MTKILSPRLLFGRCPRMVRDNRIAHTRTPTSRNLKAPWQPDVLPIPVPDKGGLESLHPPGETPPPRSLPLLPTGPFNPTNTFLPIEPSSQKSPGPGQMSIWRIEIFGQSGDTTSVNLENIFERVDNVKNLEEQPSSNFFKQILGRSVTKNKSRVRCHIFQFFLETFFAAPLPQ